EVAELEGDPHALIEALDRRLLLDDPAEVHAELRARSGAALERAGRISDAMRAYESAVRANPQQLEAVAALSRLERERRDHERLSQILEDAANNAPQGPDRAALFAERAMLLAATGFEAEAFEDARRALAERDVAESVRSELLPLATTLALRLGRHDEARAYAE